MGSRALKLEDAFNGITSLGVDTAPFIYFVEKNPTYVDRMIAIFQRVTRDMQIITSTITLTEVLVVPFSQKQTHYERQYRNMLLRTERIMSVPVNASIAEVAAQLRANYRLRTPDAIQIATAIESGCDAFLTNDLGLPRVTEISVLVLDELELAL